MPIHSRWPVQSSLDPIVVAYMLVINKIVSPACQLLHKRLKLPGIGSAKGSENSDNAWDQDKTCWTWWLEEKENQNQDKTMGWLA